MKKWLVALFVVNAFLIGGAGLILGSSQEEPRVIEQGEGGVEKDAGSLPVQDNCQVALDEDAFVHIASMMLPPQYKVSAAARGGMVMPYWLGPNESSYWRK